MDQIQPGQSESALDEIVRTAISEMETARTSAGQAPLTEEEKQSIRAAIKADFASLQRQGTARKVVRDAAPAAGKDGSTVAAEALTAAKAKLGELDTKTEQDPDTTHTRYAEWMLERNLDDQVKAGPGDKNKVLPEALEAMVRGAVLAVLSERANAIKAAGSVTAADVEAFRQFAGANSTEAATETVTRLGGMRDEVAGSPPAAGSNDGVTAKARLAVIRGAYDAAQQTARDVTGGDVRGAALEGVKGDKAAAGLTATIKTTVEAKAKGVAEEIAGTDLADRVASDVAGRDNMRMEVRGALRKARGEARRELTRTLAGYATRIAEDGLSDLTAAFEAQARDTAQPVPDAPAMAATYVQNAADAIIAGIVSDAENQVAAANPGLTNPDDVAKMAAAQAAPEVKKVRLAEQIALRSLTTRLDSQSSKVLFDGLVMLARDPAIDPATLDRTLSSARTSAEASVRTVYDRPGLFGRQRRSDVERTERQTTRSTATWLARQPDVRQRVRDAAQGVVADRITADGTFTREIDNLRNATATASGTAAAAVSAGETRATYAARSVAKNVSRDGITAAARDAAKTAMDEGLTQAALKRNFPAAAAAAAQPPATPGIAPALASGDRVYPVDLWPIADASIHHGQFQGDAIVHLYAVPVDPRQVGGPLTFTPDQVAAVATVAPEDVQVEWVDRQTGDRIGLGAWTVNRRFASLKTKLPDGKNWAIVASTSDWSDVQTQGLSNVDWVLEREQIPGQKGTLYKPPGVGTKADRPWGDKSHLGIHSQGLGQAALAGPLVWRRVRGQVFRPEEGYVKIGAPRPRDAYYIPTRVLGAIGGKTIPPLDPASGRERAVDAHLHVGNFVHPVYVHPRDYLNRIDAAGDGFFNGPVAGFILTLQHIAYLVQRGGKWSAYGDQDTGTITQRYGHLNDWRLLRQVEGMSQEEQARVIPSITGIETWRLKGYGLDITTKEYLDRLLLYFHPDITKSVNRAAYPISGENTIFAKEIWQLLMGRKDQTRISFRSDRPGPDAPIDLATIMSSYEELRDAGIVTVSHHDASFTQFLRDGRPVGRPGDTRYFYKEMALHMAMGPYDLTNVIPHLGHPDFVLSDSEISGIKNRGGVKRPLRSIGAHFLLGNLTRVSPWHFDLLMAGLNHPLLQGGRARSGFITIPRGCRRSTSR
jgi:hypothetical protein